MSVSMEDRELLELAAKAAGMTGGWGDHIDYHNGEVDLSNYWVVQEGDEIFFWNPLEDDGDALRLAMVLELGVVCKRGSDPYERNRSVVTDPYRVNQLRIVEPHRGKPEYATRRAIVRAAAEIGKAMQEKH